MVKGIDGNDNIIKLKGQKQTLDTNNLEGLKKTRKNEAIFDKFDENRDGTLDTREANNMQTWIKETAGNTKISKREMKKATKDKSTFEALSNLAQQQNDLKEKNEYTEKNQGIVTHVVKDNNLITKFDTHTDKEGITTEEYDNGTKKIKYQDGAHDEIDKEGTITKFNKDGDKIAVIKDGKTTTFSGNKITVKDEKGEILEETEVEDGKEIKNTYERKDGKTIKRQTTNGNLDFITVSETENGHNIDTKYLTEEDMKNNKPSEQVKDAQNPALKTVTKYTYLDNGNVKIETTDPSGKVTTTFKNDKGEEIENPEAQTTYTVQKGDSITKIVKDALKAQGIENPTAEQLKKAKAEFLELNKDLVKTYNGVKQEWKGNKFFYPDDVVKIPKFEKPEEAEENEAPAKPEKKPKLNLTEKQKKALEKAIQELQNKEIGEKIKDIQKLLGDNFKVEKDNDGKIVIKDKNGNTLDEATKIVNDKTTDKDDIDTILKKDTNNNLVIEFSEFKSFIEAQLKDIDFEITDSNKAKFEKIIKKHFDSIDSVKKDGSLTRAELETNAKKAIQKLTDDLGDL
jgi:antitoxin component of MazEF toxin-antitoxin module